MLLVAERLGLGDNLPREAVERLVISRRNFTRFLSTTIIGQGRSCSSLRWAPSNSAERSMVTSASLMQSRVRRVQGRSLRSRPCQSVRISCSLKNRSRSCSLSLPSLTQGWQVGGTRSCSMAQL